MDWIGRITTKNLFDIFKRHLLFMNVNYGWMGSITKQNYAFCQISLLRKEVGRGKKWDLIPREVILPQNPE